MKKAVILDLNGVLIKSEPLSLRFAKKFNMPSEEFVKVLKEILPQVRTQHAPRIYSLFTPWLHQWSINLNEEDFLEFWFQGEYLDQQALSITKELREIFGYNIYTLSNNFKERVAYYRDHFQELFEIVHSSYFSCETGKVKPDTDSWTQILNNEHILPEHCIFIDDSEENITTAEALGISTYKDIHILIEGLRQR